MSKKLAGIVKTAPAGNSDVGVVELERALPLASAVTSTSSHVCLLIVIPFLD
jgi:hypothetical protein